MRFIIAACLTAKAVGALSASPLLGRSLVINWCNASSPAQQFTVNPYTVSTPDGVLCFTQSAPFPAALTLQLCVPGASTQSWVYNSSTQLPLAFTQTLDGNCLLWNTQGGPGYERPMSTLGVYGCGSGGTPFDSIFRVNYPAPGLIAAMETSPGNSTFSNLCVEAYAPPPPPPPPLPTAEQVAWFDGEMACFIHYNMATAAGSQGCGGGEPPPIAIWNPSALDTDSWIAAGVAMGCTRFVYVAKHGCGFCAWPTRATINGTEYPYSVKYANDTTDVVASFVQSALKAKVGYGFYYSLGSNSYTSFHKVPEDEYNALVMQQLTELWGGWGAAPSSPPPPLAEIWFDVRGPARLFASGPCC